MLDQKFITYYRVSTDRQGESGLGLEAQRAAVLRYLAEYGQAPEQEFTEVETGKRADRPQLRAALDACKRTKAILVIAKLDRLARNVAFIANLMESGVEFVAVDNPHASKLMLHMLAAFAEHEREQISKRTTEALAAARQRGTRLGTNGATLAQTNRRRATEFAATMDQTIRSLRSEGHITVRAIQAELNRRSILSASGRTWHLPSVHRLLKRLGAEIL